MTQGAALYDRLAVTALRFQGFQSHQIATSVGRVHVLRGEGRGNLPPVVLLHGFTSMGAHYIPLIPAVRPWVKQLVLPDLPAHGLSDIPREGVHPDRMRAGITEALDEMIDEPAVLFGNSMGGLAAIHYALARPEKVRGAILCSPGGAPMTHDEIPHFTRRFRLQSHTEALAFIDRVMARRSAMRSLLAWGVRRRMQVPHYRHLLASIRPEELLAPEQLSALKMPVMLLWGRGDRVLPSSHRDFFVKHLPRHTRVVEPHGVGHSPYLEDPRLVADHILDFLHEVDTRRLRATASERAPARP